MLGLCLFSLVVAGVIALVARFSGASVFWLLLVPLLGNLLTGVLFFRNPTREIPREPGVLVSPADGQVVEVETVHQGEYLDGPALKVAIFLSVFDVHVNRAPGTGQIEYRHHRPGAYHDARSADCVLKNESLGLGLRLEESPDGSEERLLVRAISGAIARRIVYPVRVNDRVERGGLIGMIKYGSRAEIYLAVDPSRPGWETTVRVGDRVRGGSSILFRRVHVT